MSKVDEGVLDALRALDTPTVCNALELVAPDRRGYGYTVEPLLCTRPELGSMVGHARTAVIRAMHPVRHFRQRNARTAGRLLLLHRQRAQAVDHRHPGPRRGVPGIRLLLGRSEQQHPSRPRLHRTHHRRQRARPAPTSPRVFRCWPTASDRLTHSCTSWVSATSVNVAGMRVSDGDLLHADQHGAAVIPADVAREVPEAAAVIARREAVIINASQEKGFDFERLRRAWGDQAEVH